MLWIISAISATLLVAIVGAEMNGVGSSRSDRAGDTRSVDFTAVREQAYFLPL